MKRKLYMGLVIFLCCIALFAVGTAEGSIGGEAEAGAFVQAFLASPYVGEAENGRTLRLTQTQSGWRAVLEDETLALPTLTLCFTADGRIAQYQNSAYELPPLENFTVEENSPDYDAAMIDNLRDALFPAMNNHAGGVYARRDDALFFTIDTLNEWLGLVLEAGTPKVVAYGDFGTDDAKYLAYLSRGEAAAAAAAALAEAYGSSESWAERLELIHAEFVMQAGHSTDAELSQPYWFCVFGDETDDMKSQYEALINAEDGGVLELHDPSQTGNG